MTASVTAVTDWNPLDPDYENTFYDLSSWTSDQQAELTASLAQANIPHAWVELELVVPAEMEDTMDTLFDRLEKELGIGIAAVSGGVDDDDDITEYELDEYTIAERRELTELLVLNRITHRWKEHTLIVPTAAEDIVDGLLDDFDNGEVVIEDDDEES
ncbi:MAG: hypothetical protein RLZ37_329 [Actinomycetota bacterium]